MQVAPLARQIAKTCRYVGKRTRREVGYARQTGKRVSSIESGSMELTPAQPVTHDTPERQASDTANSWPCPSPLVTDWALCMDAEMRANRGKGAEVDWLRCEPTDL